MTIFCSIYSNGYNVENRDYWLSKFQRRYTVFWCFSEALLFYFIKILDMGCYTVFQIWTQTPIQWHLDSRIWNYRITTMGGLCLESVKNARDHKTYNQVAPQDGNLFIFLLFLTLKAFTERSLLKQLQPYSRIQGYLWLQDVQQIIVRGECTSAVLQRFPCVGATLLAHELGRAEER